MTIHDTPTAAEAEDRRRADALDDALDRLADYRFLDGPGLAVHAPMAAEALTNLGLADEVPRWVDAYVAAQAPLPAPPTKEPIDPRDPTSWRPALGDPSRLTDWNQVFDRLLAESPWPSVVSQWADRLIDGYAGAFTHGLLRTAHAVRALERRTAPSPAALRELATGLAFWAGTFKRLPGRPELTGRRSLPEAIATIPRPTEPWTAEEAGLMLRLDELVGFPDAVSALAPPGPLAAPLSDLTLAFARFMAANPQAPAVGINHAITPVVAARTLVPYLPTHSTADLYARLWQVGAAIVAGFTPAGASVDGAIDTDPPAPGDLVDQVVGHPDPHAVKLTEACLREHADHPDPAYLLAAQHLIATMPRRP